MNGVQTRFKCKLDVKRCKRFVFPPSSLLPRSNALKTKAIRYFQTDRTLTRIVSPPLQDKLYLGNLNSLRDWGYAKDYVECMWLILQHDTPEDFVIATGEYHTVREFATLAFKEVGIDLHWEGEGVNEKGIDTATGKVLVEVDPKYFRPAEVEQLLGDPTKAKTLLGWNPRKTSFEELVKIMVKHDMKFVKKLHLKASC